MPIKISNFFKPSSPLTIVNGIKQEEIEHQIINFTDDNLKVDKNINYSTMNSCYSTSSEDSSQAFIKNVKIEPEEEFSIVSTLENLQTSFKVEESLKFKRIKSKPIKQMKFELKLEENSVNPTEKPGVKCSFCPKILSQKRKLNEHVLRMHPEQLNNLHSCKICNSKFIKEFKLNQHMKIKHLNAKVQHFDCDFDGKVFKTRSSLYLHMRQHKSSIKCKICQVELKARAFLPHMKNSHSDSSFQCEICPKLFKSQSSLKAHQNIHNKRFECKICNKKFPEPNRLKRHEKQIHENIRNFECEDCNKKFITKSRLKVHQKSHDKIRAKPFKCQRCNYTTDLAANFKHHQQFHENQDKKFASMKNPIKCDKCEVYCRNKDSLWMHNRRVHSKIEYQCDLCGQYGRIKLNMERHLRIVHMKNKKL